MTKERKKLVRKLDDLCRKILLIRDQSPAGYFRCISCHRLLPLHVFQVGHYISRRYESFRWSLKNIHGQCSSCNGFHSGNPIEYRKSLVELYGENEVAFMENIYRASPHYSTFDLNLKVQQYKEILKAYEAGNGKNDQ